MIGDCVSQVCDVSRANLWIGETLRGGRLEVRVVGAGARDGVPASGTLLCCEAGAPDARALAALLSSRIVGRRLGERVDVDSLLGLELPDISRAFEAQLAVLWSRYGDEQAREAIGGSFDRVAAEIYGLSTGELIDLETR